MQTFLITGANRGIGLGLVQELLKLRNARVIATCRQPDTATELTALRESYGLDRVSVLPLDVTDPISFENLKVALRDSGTNSIDVLIANAGIIGERQSFMSTDVDDMTTVFNTNVLGPMLTFQALAPLVTSSTSRIFTTISSNMGSITATSSQIGAGAVSYRVSKAAVNMLNSCLAVDPAVSSAGCKVLCIHPGWVQTDMGSSGGRNADITVEESACGIVDIVVRTAVLQSDEKYGREATTQHQGNHIKDFEVALKESACNLLFVNYDGRILKW